MDEAKENWQEEDDTKGRRRPLLKKEENNVILLVRGKHKEAGVQGKKSKKVQTCEYGYKQKYSSNIRYLFFFVVFNEQL